MKQEQKTFYRVAFPAEMLFDVPGKLDDTPDDIRERAEAIMREWLDQEDGFEPEGDLTLAANCRVYVLGTKAYRETDGQPGDFSVVDEWKE